jgi:hypothetical protein
VVMLPDPDKDYEADPTIQIIWQQFRQALKRAKRVFVLGHSLNDPALVNVITGEVEPRQRLGVAVLADEKNRETIHTTAASTAELV